MPSGYENAVPNEETKMKMYSIVYNFSLAPSGFMKNITEPSPTDPNMFKLKIDIDNGILRYLHKEYKREGDPP